MVTQCISTPDPDDEGKLLRIVSDPKSKIKCQIFDLVQDRTTSKWNLKFVTKET